MPTATRDITRIQDCNDYADALVWASLQTFNAGAAIASGQGITMADDTWVGIGAALERIEFDEAGDVKVIGANFQLVADDQLLEFGAAQDYSIQWDGDDAVHTISAGQFRFVGGNVELEDTISPGNLGVIMKGTGRFIHNFHHHSGNTAVPEGKNTFIGVNAGNFTMGSTATETYHASRNAGIGDNVLGVLTTGYYNMAMGRGALQGCTTGYSNVGVGINCLTSITDGNSNVGIGYGTLQNCNSRRNVAIGYASLLRITSGEGNVGLGWGSGWYIADGSTPNETTDFSVYIGRNTRASADGADNEIVIGYNAIGKGTNTAIIGGSANTNVYLTGGAVIGSDGGATNYAQFAADGELTLAGTARVKKTIDMAGATFEIGATAPSSNVVGTYLTWSYDIDDDSVMTFELPHDWAVGTDLTIKVDWGINRAYGTESAEVQWNLAWSACPHDASESLAAPTHSGVLDPGDQNIPATANFLTRTTMGNISGASLSVEDEIGLQISRVDIDDGADPGAAVDPYITHLYIEYIADKLGEAT